MTPLNKCKWEIRLFSTWGNKKWRWESWTGYNNGLNLDEIHMGSDWFNSQSVV